MCVMYDGFFALVGLLRQIRSDRGKNFESKFFQELCELTGVQKTHTTAFHPSLMAMWRGYIARSCKCSEQLFKIIPTAGHNACKPYGSIQDDGP